MFRLFFHVCRLICCLSFSFLTLVAECGVGIVYSLLRVAYYAVVVCWLVCYGTGSGVLFVRCVMASIYASCCALCAAVGLLAGVRGIAAAG